MNPRVTPPGISVTRLMRGAQCAELFERGAADQHLTRERHGHDPSPQQPVA